MECCSASSKCSSPPPRKNEKIEKFFSMTNTLMSLDVIANGLIWPRPITFLAASRFQRLVISLTSLFFCLLVEAARNLVIVPRFDQSPIGLVYISCTGPQTKLVLCLRSGYIAVILLDSDLWVEAVLCFPIRLPMLCLFSSSFRSSSPSYIRVCATAKSPWGRRTFYSRASKYRGREIMRWGSGGRGEPINRKEDIRGHC